MLMSRTAKSLAALLLGATAILADDDKFQLEEFNPALAVDMGQVVRGQLLTTKLDLLPVNRNIVSLSQSAFYGDQWQFKAGLMGIIWWPFSATGLQPHERTMRVEPRLSIAQARRNFGDKESGRFLAFGYFPYKYNPDAKNLGEYLYRSGTYPGLVSTTDGFQLLNHAAYDAYGATLQLQTFGGLVKHTFNVFAEPAVIPIGDLTPAYEAEVNITAFRIGVGAAYNRLISFNKDLVTPKEWDNAYIEVKANDRGISPYKGPYSGAASNVKPLARAGDSIVNVLHHWTHKGVKLMGRASLDLGRLFSDEIAGPDGLRIFTEVAVLGWENQPYYYEKRSQRVPFMAGISIPTFGLLDALSFQGEHYSTPFDNIKDYVETSRPTWKVNFSDTTSHGLKRDDWKWSVYGRKSLGRMLKLHAQVANDHLRLPIFDYSYTETTLMQDPTHWYYLIRLECGI